MGIITAKISKLGRGYKVSEHFTLGELASPNNDTVKYCPETLALVEKLRTLTECKYVIVTSGYRDRAENKRVGGASNSPHLKGYAIDVYFVGSKYTHKQIACMAQDLGFKGIGYMCETGIHLDMEPRSWGYYRGDETRGYSNNVGGDFYAYYGIEKGSLPTKEVSYYSGVFPKLPLRGYFKKGDKGDQVKRLQSFLNWSINAGMQVDGILGDITISATKVFQKKVGLTADGLFGKSSLAKAKNFKK